jgi:excinuclease UvrABC nuclease subunit
MHRVWQPDLSQLPERPGVYRFHNARGGILYIGKALNLRRRIASYFQRRMRQPARLRRLAARTRAVTIQETGSELEALLLESHLLKQETPPCNRLSIRYAALPFVKVNLNDSYPRLLLTRDFRDDGSHYLGPFPRIDMAEAVLAALQRLFPLRTCDVPIRPGIAPHPCSAFHVRTCAAPCVGESYAVPYRHHVEELLALLTQGHTAVIQRLIEMRQQAADAMRFERARHVHNVLTVLEQAIIGRPLALLPVAYRNMAVIVEQRHVGAHDIFLICRGLFAGRISIAGQRLEGQALTTLLKSCAGYRGTRPREGEMVVDELRIVASWLQRTRPHARWIPFEAEMELAEVSAAIQRALPTMASMSAGIGRTQSIPGGSKASRQPS